MRDPRKRKLFSAIYLFLVSCCTLALVLPSFAWFFRPQTDFDASFDASIVRAYFDADSKVDATDPSKSTFFITKPVHLYNLAYLTDKGVFTQPTNFQFGKQRKNPDGSLVSEADTTYYVYKDNYSDETKTNELTYRTIDMSVYDSEGGIPPIGVGLKTDGGDTFNHTLAGNGVTIANCTVKDSIGGIYFENVGLFGVLDDGAAVKNFKLLNLTLTTSANNTFSTVNCGLVAGFLDQSADGKIIVENIGIANSDFKTRSKIYSKFSFIGSGTEKGIETANNFFTKADNSGDTGVVNIDQIYTSIRMSMQDTNATYTDANKKTTDYYTINGYKDNNIFDPYVLRDNNGLPSTKFNRGVDFKGQRTITKDSVNALGVFDLVTANKNTDEDFTAALDAFALKSLTYNDTEKATVFYYSTAEVYNAEQNFNIEENKNKQIGVSIWSPAYYATKESPLISPEHYDATKQSSQALFYAASFKKDAEKNYFSDTQYTYLRELFEETLIDKDGKNVIAGTKDFGVAAKYVADDGTIKNVESMQYYLKLTRTSSSQGYLVDAYELNGETWIANSVYFTLSRTANVTVFASSKDCPNDSRVSIYQHEQTIANQYVDTNQVNKNPLRNPMYAMWVPQNGATIYCYPEGGDDNTAPVEAPSGSKLYAHTFKLPAGRYFLNVPDHVVSLMHISVQGQESGDMGDIGKNGFSIDFVTEEESIDSEFMVGDKDYVYSQTAFGIELQQAVAFQVCFLRIKNPTENTDVVYAYVLDASQTNFLTYINEGYGTITATNPVDPAV